MNTFALLSSADPMHLPKADVVGSQQLLTRRHLRQEPSHAVRMSGSDGGVSPALSQTVGIRMARSSVARWYHGGINE